MTKEQLQKKLTDNFFSYEYTYESFSNGSCEYLVYPANGESLRGWIQNNTQGAPMRYRFNNKGESI